MKKKFACIALLSTMTLSAVLAPIVATADEYDTQIQNKNNEIANLKSQESQAQAQVDAVQGQIDSINQKVEELKAENKKLEAANEKLNKEVQDLSVRVNERAKTLNNQARNIQTNGTGTNMLDVLLTADSITDAIARLQAMQKLSSANRDLMNQQKADLESMQAKLAENAKQTKVIWDNQATLTEQANSLKTQQAQLSAAKLGLAATRANSEEERNSLLGQQAAAKQAAQQEAQRVAAQQEAQRVAAQAKAKEEEAAKNNNNNTSIPNTGDNSNNNTGTDTDNNNNNGGGEIVSPPPVVTPPSSGNNPYPAGQCTAFVWAYFHDMGITIPTFQGNAGAWVAYANSGAVAGTIAVFPPAGDNGGYGHVAVVTSVSGSQMSIIEGNYLGMWGHTRSVNISDAIGFIAV